MVTIHAFANVAEPQMGQAKFPLWINKAKPIPYRAEPVPASRHKVSAKEPALKGTDLVCIGFRAGAALQCAP